MFPIARCCKNILIDVMSRMLVVSLISLLAHCNGYVNVARGKPTKQIDTDSDNWAYLAVDGNTNFSSGCTHTQSSENTWWVVDFLIEYLVHEVQIANRPTQFTSSWLQQFKVHVSKENPLNYPGFPLTLPGQLCFYRDSPISGEFPETIPCVSTIMGRYLTVFKADNDILAICELEALATTVTLHKQLQAFPNVRKEATPFFTQKRARGSIECLTSVCSNRQNGTATVVQYRASDGLCECIQASNFDNRPLRDVNSTGWIMYMSNSN